VGKEDVKVSSVGKENWQRDVRFIIRPETISDKIIIGETINPPGNWSGTPPHKHDTNRESEETQNEELYYFLFNKESGWGMERIYDESKQINELIHLKNFTTTIKLHGYHQVVSAPGYLLYYLWFIAGPTNKLKAFEDPDHSWIKNSNS
jgi:5-deoxy-glucuronate isomerase